MNKRSLSKILADLHDDIEQRLITARQAFGSKFGQ
jgi:hypothetical protein